MALEGLKQSLSRVKLPAFSFGRRTGGGVTVDLTADQVRILASRVSGGKPVLQEVFQKQFAENADDEMGDYLKASFKSLKGFPPRAVCLVAAKLFISKNVDMPSHDPDEISKIVDLQAGRYTPYSRNEIVIDYLCMDVPGQHYTNVLLIIMNRKTVDRYYRIFERAGVMIERIAISPEGMALAYSGLGDVKGGSDAVGGVHMEAHSSDLVIADRQQMVFVRSIPVGAADFKANREEAQAAFVSELNNSINAYQTQGVGRPIHALLITGLIEELSFLEDAIRQSVPFLVENSIPVKMINYKSQFQASEAVRSVLESSRDLSFFDMMASATSLASMKIDLVPKEIKLRQHFLEEGRERISLGILLMISFVLVSLFLVSKIYVKRLHVKKLERLNQSTFEQARKLELSSTKSRLLRNLLESRGRGLYVFEKVTSLVGREVYLTQMAYDSEGKVTLTGTAASMSLVFSLVTDLEESNYFSSVKTNQTKSRREGGKDVADFEIAGVLAEGI